MHAYRKDTFDLKSVAHLIYHGSTKYELTELDPIGQFGTGFLTTHLISKTVTIKGIMNNGKQFCFELDRRGDNADELKMSMDASWDAFSCSLNESASEYPGDFTTEFGYPLADGIVEVVEAGIGDLIANAAYLLAFNNRIRSIYVEQPNRRVTIKKRAVQQLTEGTERLHVEEIVTGNAPVSRFVTVISDNETSAAVEMAEVGDNWSIIAQGQIPRIFVAFPLTGTRNFCLPIVINNEKFQPREERDTLVLVSNLEGKHHPNMLHMEKACDVTVRMVILSAEEGWNGAETLLRLNPLIQSDLIDTNWFRKLLADRFVRPLRAAKVMTTVIGDRIAPINGVIPLLPDLELCCDLWDIAVRINDLSGRLPQRDAATVWAANLTSWATFLSELPEQLPESFTLQKLCKQVSTWGNVVDLGKQLKEGTDPIEWLNQLHALISKADQRSLFDQDRLISSQSGTLKKITDLSRDPGIDEELKDIAESLDITVRDDLLNQRMCMAELLELKIKSAADVLMSAVQKLKDKAKSVDAPFRRIAVPFFVWLVRHGEIDKLDGFPVLTRATTDDDPALATLFRDPARNDEKILAPSYCWPEPASQVVDLFPKRQTMADAYSQDLLDDPIWQKISDEGYVRLNPLFRTLRNHIPFIPDEPIPLSEKDKKQKHRTKEAVEVSAIAFFEKDETGLDAVRSKIRAVNLLLYLSTYVLPEDASALDTHNAECECGSTHNYYRASWLVPMWDRQWVPLGDNKRSAATAESIAQLFDGREDQLRLLTTGKGRKLLEALNISLADLSLRAVAKDEDKRISLIDSLTNIVYAANNDAEKVKLVAEEIRQSPKLLDEIREHRDRREKVLRNMQLGTAVEKLLEGALSEYDLKVTRTGTGSDYEVEEDFIIDDEEINLLVENDRQSFLIEIKATIGTVARMTVKQAETAVANKDKFLLCMVRLDTPAVTPEIVQERCRFVMDIGHQIQPVWEEYNKYKDTKDKVCTHVGEVGLIVQDSQVRFSVGEGAWTAGKSIEDAVKLILSTSAARKKQ